MCSPRDGILLENHFANCNNIIVNCHLAFEMSPTRDKKGKRKVESSLTGRNRFYSRGWMWMKRKVKGKLWKLSPSFTSYFNYVSRNNPFELPFNRTTNDERVKRNENGRTSLARYYTDVSFVSIRDRIRAPAQFQIALIANLNVCGEMYRSHARSQLKSARNNFRTSGRWDRSAYNE